MKPKIMTLTCCSMAHVADRAWSFRFIDRCWDFVEVRPDAVLMRNSEGEIVKVESRGRWVSSLLV